MPVCTLQSKPPPPGTMLKFSQCWVFREMPAGRRVSSQAVEDEAREEGRNGGGSCGFFPQVFCPYLTPSRTTGG